MIKNLYEDLMLAEEVVQICGHHEWFMRCNCLMQTWGYSFVILKSKIAFRLAWCSPHCHFDGDIGTTAQAPLAAEGRPSRKQPLAN